MPASDDFFLDWPSPRHVHYEGCDEAAQVEALVESVGKCCEIGLGVLAELQCLEGSSQRGLEIAQHVLGPSSFRVEPNIQNRWSSSSRVGIGACQGSCRYGHAASAVLFGLGRDAVLTTTSRSGFKATAPIGSQLRVWRDQRAGLRARAWRYSA
jgi:hypothetical protein